MTGLQQPILLLERNGLRLHILCSMVHLGCLGAVQLKPGKPMNIGMAQPLSYQLTREFKQKRIDNNSAYNNRVEGGAYLDKPRDTTIE